MLAGYISQSTSNFELLIADDGSTAETGRVIEQFKSRANINLRHVWHEDHGFRAAAIRNRALAATQADYVVFSDGDCVPFPDFVAQHQRLAQPGWFVSGNRVLLSERFTRRALRDETPLHLDAATAWIPRRLRGEVNRFSPLLRLPDSPLRRLAPQRWQGAKTCNLAAWRDDLLKVNGLDETYSGWGLEDSDLVIRLIRSGVRHKSGRYATPVLHLWHADNDRGNLAENQRQLDALLVSDRVRARIGLDQYT